MSIQRVRVKSSAGMYPVFIGEKLLPAVLAKHLPAKVPVAMLVNSIVTGKQIGRAHV